MRKKLFIMLSVMAVLILAWGIPVFAADQMAKLDAGGTKILTIIRRIGYWIILIKCIADLIKAGMNGDTHAIGRIIMTYVMIYGALFFVPWALRLVEGIF